MALEISCPSCQAELRVGDSNAGQKMKCPKCATIFRVPDPGMEEDEAAGEIEEVGEADEPRPRSQFEPCPRCGARKAKRVLWTPWGSFYGPAMLCHVRCPKCGYAYNGRSGRSNLLGAIVFVTVPLLLMIGVVGIIFYMLWKKGHLPFLGGA